MQTSTATTRQSSLCDGNDNHTTIRIRPMLRDDLPAVLAIQSVCYTQIEPESRASFEAKLAAAPASCYVALGGAGIVGYLVALPGLFGAPPPLNADACHVPAAPDCLYLHDLAVAPPARASGAGRALVEAFFGHLETARLARATLIAIQSSAPYWQRHGFRAVAAGAALQARLASYGGDVQYMECVRVDK